MSKERSGKRKRTISSAPEVKVRDELFAKGYMPGQHCVLKRRVREDGKVLFHLTMKTEPAQLASGLPRASGFKPIEEIREEVSKIRPLFPDDI